MMALVECRAEIHARARDAVDVALRETELVGWSIYEDVLAQRAWVIGTFSDVAEGAARWRELRTVLPRGATGAPGWRELADQDWRESYKAHFRAWRCGPLHWVPEWERATYRVPRGHAAVYLDPGLAFGTGNHETTRLCCRRLVEFAGSLSPRARRGWRVIDAGCGSGILAISAAKLGCRYVFGFDNDPEAVAVARENARRNGVSRTVRITAGEIGPLLRRRRAELVLANIRADVLAAQARELLAAVAPGGLLVLSGILAQELGATRAAFQRWSRPRVRVHARRLGEWADIAVRQHQGNAEGV